MSDTKNLVRLRSGCATLVEATPAEIGAIPSDLIGAPSGIAPLGPDSIVPMENLPPGFVADIVEVANFAALPVIGAPTVIYKTMDDGKTWMWGGTSYAQISGGVVLGETSSTAYRGDRGKTAYDHSQATGSNPHGTTAAQVGAEPSLGNPGGVAPLWLQTIAGVRAWVQLVAADITDLATVLGAYLTKSNPTYIGVLSGPSAKIGDASGASSFAMSLKGPDYCQQLNQTTGTSKAASYIAQTPASIWAWGALDTGLDGAPVGCWAINDASAARVWGTSTGMWIRGTLDLAGSLTGVDAKLLGAGSDTFGSAPGVMMADAATGYSNACAVQMTAAGGMAFWTWAGGAWRNYWSIGYLGNLRNSSWAGGGSRPVYVNNSGDLTPTGPDLFVTKTASYNFTGITADLIKHSSGDVVATLSGGVPGKRYTLVSASTLLIVIPAGVTLYGTTLQWNSSTGFSLGGMRPIMLQCLSSTEWLLPNYGE